ncbi:uncharacterized protein TNCV_1438361 [Trichonephila clavipes]|nr:uncharacterized protein TNCV_1438361 [Trichonephila clavipes]
MYSRSYTGRWWQYYVLGDILLGVSGTHGCGRADRECYRVSEHHCGPVAPLHGLFFQLEMECSNRTTPRVTRLKLCWSSSRNMILNSS